MIIHSSFNNNVFTHVKYNKRENTSDTNAHVKNETSKTANDEVLGYKIDKDGYFTEEFNKAANIPEDIKIHSETMKRLVEQETRGNIATDVFKSIDIAKTVGNAYKILSSVVGTDILNSKQSFSIDEIAQFPQGYTYHQQTMEVLKVYDTDFEWRRASELSMHSGFKQRTGVSTLFWKSFEDHSTGKPAGNDIFNDAYGGRGPWSYAYQTKDKYINSDGTITKGGLLVAAMRKNLDILEGETTVKGKLEGYDKSMSYEDIMQYARTAPYKKEVQIEWGITPKENKTPYKNNNTPYEYKDPIMQIFEDIEQFQKDLLKHLDKKLEEQKRLQKLLKQRKSIDINA